MPGGVVDGKSLQGGASGMFKEGMQAKHRLVGQGPKFTPPHLLHGGVGGGVHGGEVRLGGGIHAVTIDGGDGWHNSRWSCASFSSTSSHSQQSL